MSAPPLSLAAIRQPAFLYGPDGTIAEANDLAEAIAGRPLAGRTLAAVVGLFDVRSPAGTPLMAADLPAARALAGEEAVDVPLVVTAADGRTLHVLVTTAPIRNGGAVVGALSIWQDISARERTRAEAETASEELRVTEEELREQGGELARAVSDLDRQRRLLDNILGAMPHQVSLWDRDERLVWANERFAAGLGEPREALAGRTWRELWRDIPEIASIADGALQSVAAGTPYACEVETAGPAGPGWLAATFLPIFGDSLLVITEEITDRKRMEAERESLARFPGENPHPVLRLEGGHTIIYANAAALAMLEGTAGSPNTDAAGEIVRTATTAFASGMRPEMEYATGDEIYQLSFVPVADRSYVNIYGRKITRRKRAEATAREREEQVRNLIENSADGILITDEEGRLTTWNRGMETITGLAAGDALGRPGWEVQAQIVDEEWAGPGFHERYRGLWDRILQNGVYPHLNRLLDVRIRTPTGESRHLQQMIFATPTPRGFQVGGILRDITEQKRAEEALREFAWDLQRYSEDLRRSNEDLERFAYVSSHDLQEPLRSIVSFSQLLERRYRGQLGEDADEYIAFIVEGGNRMQALIQDLLAYSRVNTTKQDLRPTEMEDVLAAVERSLDLQLREAGAAITHDPLPVVLADPLQLEQVLANLVSNAIKFRKPEEPLRIHVGARRLNGVWEFSVADNGIGIEPEYFDRIFVIFQRLHTKEAYPGTGIGLAIVKRIIDRHGGTIRVESTPGEGTTFFFTLPAA